MWKKLKRSKNSHKADKSPAAASSPKVEAAPVVATKEEVPAAASVVEPAPEAARIVSEPTPPVAETPKEAVKPASAVELLIARISEGAAFAQPIDLATPPYRVAAGVTVEGQVDAVSGVSHIRMGAGNAKAFAGSVPDGYAIRFPDEVERAASGNKVILSVVARAGGVAKSRFAISYSTNEVGNSGWRWQNAGPDWEVFKIELGVPPMKNGNGDFAGLLAGVDGEPPTDLCFVSLRVL
jgi:hypothetical protein